MRTIFLLIDWFLPAYKGGGPIQSIAALVAKPLAGCRYKIICGHTDFDGTVLPVQTNKWLQWNEQTDVYYADGQTGPSVLAVLRSELKRHPDHVVYLNGIYSPRFVLKPLLFSGAKEIIISVRGMLHPGALGQKPLKKKLFLSLWRWLGLQKKVVFHASTTDEAAFVKSAFGDACKVAVAANFSRSFAQQPVVAKRVGELKLVSISLISAMKNHLLVLKALAHVKEEISYTIYGPIKDEGYWQQCLYAINSLPKNITVHYAGELPPHQIEAALQPHHVFILPSESENFGHAIYEALSAGKPVITSHNTPWNHLQEAGAGANCELTETSVAEAIAFFAEMDNEGFQRWSDGAHSVATKSRNDDDLLGLYSSLFRKGGGAAKSSATAQLLPAQLINY